MRSAILLSRGTLISFFQLKKSQAACCTDESDEQDPMSHRQSSKDKKHWLNYAVMVQRTKCFMTLYIYIFIDFHLKTQPERVKKPASIHLCKMSVSS